MTSRLHRRNYGRNHAYYLATPKGEVKLDGVTTLIGNGMRKKALETWAANETAGYTVDHWEELAALPVSQRLEKIKKARFEVRDAAAARGTEVHQLAERISAGETVEVPDDIAGHVESAVRFLDDFQVHPLLTETSVYHPRLLYGGTLDMVITSDKAPGRVILADWKTNRSGIYGETALQLSAYANAGFYVNALGDDLPMDSLGITDHWAVWVRADGYSVYQMANTPEVFKTFQYVAAVARRTEGDDRPLDALKGAELFADRMAA